MQLPPPPRAPAPTSRRYDQVQDTTCDHCEHSLRHWPPRFLPRLAEPTEIRRATPRQTPRVSPTTRLSSAPLSLCPAPPHRGFVMCPPEPVPSSTTSTRTVVYTAAGSITRSRTIRSIRPRPSSPRMP